MKSESQESFMEFFLKYLAPPIVIVGAVLAAVIIVKAKPKPAEVELERIIPDVQVLTVKNEAVSLDVESQGTVVPRVATQLISEVSGRVEWVSPALYAGGFFNQGDLLIKIEASDYVAAVASARGMVAQMRVLYEQELALSAQAKKDWEGMGKGEPSELVLRIPQLEKARADMEFADASLKVAERNLDYTQVKAPYDGRVQSKFVDVGQSVSPKTSKLAQIYSIDSVEIRLSLKSSEAEFVDLPELYADAQPNVVRPKVTLTGEYGGSVYSWDGYLDRTEGVVDPTTRLIYAVAKVDHPYSKQGDDTKPPLKVGMFVKATIHGKMLEQAFVIPSGALRPGNVVYTLDSENKLRIKEVVVAKRGVKTVVISEGLDDQDSIVMTSLSAVVDGMELSPIPVEQ